MQVHQLKDIVTSPVRSVNIPIPVLDGLRGLAVLLVMCYHFIPAIIPFGWIGVDLFFVLSGFLITGKLIESIGKPSYFQHFYSRRILRIVPLYYLVLAFTMFVLPVVMPRFNTEGFQSHYEAGAYYWTFTLNIYISLYGWLPHILLVHFWSVSTEMQFYLFWPFVVLIFAKSEKKFRAILVSLICVAIVVRVFFVNMLPVPHAAAYVLFISRMDAFSLGALLYLFYRNGRLERYKKSFRALLILCLTGVLAIIMVKQNVSWNHVEPLVRYFGYTLNAILWTCCIAMLLSSESHLKRILKSSLMRLTGRYSYGMYVFHIPIKLVIAEIADQGIAGLEPNRYVDAGWISLSFVATWFAGWLSYQFYERYFIGRLTTTFK